MEQPDSETTSPRENEAILDRALGVLLGQAAGDALGTTVEFQSARSIQARYPDRLREIVGGGPFGLQPGQITDDTELALALARSLADRGRYDADDVASRYAGWYRSGPFDVGGTIRRAFSVGRPGDAGLAAAFEAAANPSSQANGSLMRISPLGVHGWRLPWPELAALAARDSRLSHPHPLCQAACAVFTGAIGHAVRTGASARQVFDEALRVAREHPLAAPALEILEAAADAPPADYQAQMGWVRIALQNAFHQLLRCESVEEVIVATAAQGGDSDTNACIAGALAGAVHGARPLPERWTRTILSCRTRRPAEYWCGDLPELARRLCFPGADAGAAR